jgi:hypothetical protein
MRLIVNAETNTSTYVENEEDTVVVDMVDYCEENRRQAYQQEADPLFFKAQRGEATLKEWQDKIDEIKTRFPKG